MDSDSDEPIVGSDLCSICEKPVADSDRVTPGKKAIETIKRFSILKGDGKHLFLSGDDCNIVVHRDCRNSYTKNTPKKRVSPSDTVSPKKMRSAGLFNFSNSCFFCASIFTSTERKTPGKVRTVTNDDVKTKVEQQAVDRGDSQGRQVIGRICTADLKKERAQYHFTCWVQFFRQQAGPSGTPGRKPSDDLTNAMEEICEYMESSSDCQFSVQELIDLVSSKYTISERSVKRKLQEKYGDRVLLTTIHKKNPVVCFRSHSEKILNDYWYQQKKGDELEEELRIMEKAGEILRKHIESFAYDNISYPSTHNFFDEVNTMIPKPLKVLLKSVTRKKKSGSSDKNDMDRKCATIAHCLISLVRPRSFLSPILLGVGAYIHQNIGSKNLITLLSNLGLCSSYHDVKILEASVVMAPGHTIKQGAFVQFVFDNCDFNVNTIDGYGTFHNMAGIKCVTPSDAIINSKDRIVKQKRSTQSTLSEKKGLAEVVPLNLPSLTGLQDFKFPDLDDRFPTEQYEGFPSTHNVLWMVAKFWKAENIPGWQGYLETITHGGYSDPSAVITLPFIMAPPSN